MKKSQPIDDPQLKINVCMAIGDLYGAVNRLCGWGSVVDPKVNKTVFECTMALSHNDPQKQRQAMIAVLKELTQYLEKAEAEHDKVRKI